MAKRNPHTGSSFDDFLKEGGSFEEVQANALQRALVARDEVAQHGLVYDGDEVLTYLKARLQGDKPARPRKRKPLAAHPARLA
jgi:antitoxin HicB